MNINDITIVTLDEINAFDPATGDYRFSLTELQNAKIANTQDKTDVTGKGGRKLSSLKKNKAAVISGTHGLVSGGLLEAQTGGRFAKKATPVMVPDILTINTDKAVTTYKATGTAGNEIESVYIINSDGTRETKLTQDTAAGDGKFSYDPATKTLTFKTGAYTDGTEIAVYYFRKVEANVLENVSDVYSEKCALYVDATGEDKCNNLYHIQFYMPKADFSGNFDFEFGDNQTVHAFEAESLAGACGKNGALWTYTVVGSNAPDVA